MASGEGRDDAVGRLQRIMARLRDPLDGCPWDREQSFASIAPYTIEEAYEVDDAIRSGDMDGLREELGDLLLQVVYHAQMASEVGHFELEDVAEAICDKLVRRHPHVFGDAAARERGALRRHWEDEKARERAEKAAARADSGSASPDPFAGVPLALPALMRAAKLIGRADRIGADSATGDDGELVRRLEAFAYGAGGAAEEKSAPDEGLGALLFDLVRVARTRGLDAERALRDRCARYEASVRAGRKTSSEEG
jgi:MazG family protein